MRLAILLACLAWGLLSGQDVPTPEQLGTAHEQGSSSHRSGGDDEVLAAGAISGLRWVLGTLGVLVTGMLAILVATLRNDRQEHREAAAAADRREQALRDAIKDMVSREEEKAREQRKHDAEQHRLRREHDDRQASRFEGLLQRTLESEGRTTAALSQLSRSIDELARSQVSLAQSQEAQRIVLLDVVSHLPESRRDAATQALRVDPTSSEAQRMRGEAED